MAMERTQLGKGGRIMTMGMFIIDTFKYLDEEGNDTGRQRQQEIGGGGTFFTIGARHFLPASDLLQVVHIHAPTTPSFVREELLSLGEDIWDLREREDGNGTSLAVNVFKGEARDFHWISPGMRIWPIHLKDSRFLPEHHQPSVIHMPVGPERARDIIGQVDELKRSGWADARWNPDYIWEVFPANCTLAEYPLIVSLLPKITIFSPNHVEALSMLGYIPSPFTSDSALHKLFPPAALELMLHECLEIFLAAMGVVEKPTSGQGWQRGVVIRWGKEGCLVATESGKISKVPAYWTGQDQNRVVDVTGGGNAFLGGLVAGMRISNGRLEEAALYGSVAASYAIEQGGLPKISHADEEERWNGERPTWRIEQMRCRFLPGGLRD